MPEIYTAFFSEVKVNVSVVKDEWEAIPGKEDSPRTRTITEAIEAVTAQVEDIKGVLRGLREMAES